MSTTRLIQCCALLGALAGGSIPGAHASDLFVTMTEADDAYRLRAVAVLDAPEDYVYRIITDYRHADRIDPAITSIEILPTARDGVTRVKHRSEHHLGPFSFEIEWVGDIVETGHRRVDITTVPELSSFESGSAVWEMRPDGGRTWVRHESTMKPKFSILPVIGDYLVKKRVEEATRDIFLRVERYARTLMERDTHEDRADRRVALSSNSCH
jgi:hypothetical protein